MLRPSRIPLFPLDVVLLPGMHLPLHIFEPRYKLMIAKCIEEHLEFGIILAAERAIATFGCTAEIIRKTRDYPDGRMDISTEGRAVFHLVDFINEKEYYEGTIEYLLDESLEIDIGSETRLITIFEQCHVLLHGRPWMDAQIDEPATLAYRMAALVPMELSQRQSLLEMRSEAGRRAFVHKWLTEFLPKLVEGQKVRNRATGNGHGLN